MRASSRSCFFAVCVHALLLSWAAALPVRADESLFGFLKGAETLPERALELVQHVNVRADKGRGHYRAIDTKTEVEYGFTNRLTGAFYLLGQSVQTEGLRINGYLPADRNTGLRPSGVEASIKYNFLSPAKDDIGLAQYFSVSHTRIDPHSGQDKAKTSFEHHILAQKYFLDGELIWVSNLGMEATLAQRAPIADLPPDFDWPTTVEAEIGFMGGTGLSYRFVSNLFVSGELFYDTEFETEIGQERWSIQGGPSVHYGVQAWWATLSWLPQLVGGGERYEEQAGNLHLIEKTKQEIRLKVGFNF